MALQKCYYAVLEVSYTSSAEEMRKAYRRLALKLHPDKNGNTPEATMAFQTLQHAYDTLSNPTKRATYDAANPRRQNQSPNFPNPPPARAPGLSPHSSFVYQSLSEFLARAAAATPNNNEGSAKESRARAERERVRRQAEQAALNEERKRRDEEVLGGWWREWNERFARTQEQAAKTAETEIKRERVEQEKIRQIRKAERERKKVELERRRKEKGAGAIKAETPDSKQVGETECGCVIDGDCQICAVEL